MIKNAPSRECVIEQVKKDNVQFFGTCFNFLRGHNGIRPGNLHGLLATTGAGKSSLIKKLASECAEFCKVLIWLSEETAEQYQAMINRIVTNDEITKNILYVEEKKMHPDLFQDIETFLKYFEDKIVESNCGVIFVDNATTSYLYSDQIGARGQNKVARFLSKITQKYNRPVFYAAHTGKGIYDNMDRLINIEDVRGNRQLATQTEYFYIINKITVNEKQYKILRVAKHRHHDEACGFFLLSWDSEKKFYTGDTKIEFNKVNEIFLARDKIGKRNSKSTDRVRSNNASDKKTYVDYTSKETGDEPVQIAIEYNKRI